MKKVKTMLRKEDILKQWIPLSILTLVYVVGELSHFLLGILTRHMAQEIHYGDQECLASEYYTELHNMTLKKNCYEANTSKR